MQTRLLWLGLLLCAGCGTEVVVHGQPEREANRIVLLLEHYGIRAEKRTDEDARVPAYDVVIARDRKARAYEILETFNLPRPAPVTTKDLVADAGLIPTSDQERARTELGLMGDIVEALLDFPLITNAHAAVSIPQKDQLADLDQRQPRPKASVVLQYQATASDGPPVSVEMVQRFVQARVPEISPDEVHVLMIANRALPSEMQDSAACDPVSVLGVQVCAGGEPRMLALLVGVLAAAGMFAALTMFAVLRAMRYRRELATLTQKLTRG